MNDSVSHALDRALSFFSVFDVSFLVSGTVVLGAEVAVLRVAGWWPALEPEHGLLVLLAALVLAYVNGLIACAVGRRRRRGGESDRRWRARLLGNLARAEGLESVEPFASAFREGDDSEEDRLARAYVRLWNEVRGEDDTHPTFRLARQYWVRSAIFDGLSIGLLAWAGLAALGVVVAFDSCSSGGGLTLLRLALCLGVAWGAWRLSELCEDEAQAAERYQVDELVQALAWKARRSAGGGDPAAGVEGE